MHKPKINIGLDIGIASVGWAILDNDLKIIKHGVRLFPTVDHPKDSKLANAKRREKRSARRQVNRRKTLKRDFIKMLCDYKVVNIKFDRGGLFIDIFRKEILDNTLNIMALRKKGLNSPLELKELINVMYYYLAHRGVKYEIADEVNKETGEVTKQQVSKLLPIKNELKELKDYGYVLKGPEREIKYKNEQYIEEVKAIFKNQDCIKQKIKDKFIEFLERQRSFEIGPGSEKSPSPYGLWGKNETGKIVKLYETVWAKTIGKCSIYTDQYRAPEKSLTASIFNLLNDLNNLRLLQNNKKNKFITAKDKLEILKLAFKYKTLPAKVLSYLKKEYKVEEDEIVGFKIDKKKKPLLTSLESLNLFNYAKKDRVPFEIKFEDIFTINKYSGNNIVNDFVNICSQTKEVNKRINGFPATPGLKILFKNKLNDESLNQLANKAPTFSSNHSLSYKAMEEMIPILLTEQKNQMEIRQEHFNIKSERIKDKSKYIPTSWIDGLIGTPTVKRSLRQTIKVLNKIIKLYSKQYDIDNVVVEMTREHNNKQVRENITNSQNYNEKTNKVIASEVEAIQKEIEVKVQGQAQFKLWLFEQQNGKDAYTGEGLDKNKVVTDPNYVEIDHIIPYSQCFIDSRMNKVITKANARKGNKTPYQFLPSKKFNEMKPLWEKWYLRKNSNEIKNEKNDVDSVFRDKRKYNYIISTLDYSKPENQMDFIARNLVDTSYTVREVLITLKEFFKINEKPTKIKTINGKMTNFIRKYIDNPKKNGTLNRPEGVPKETWDPKTFKKNRIWHGHHAEDAVMIVYGALANYQTMKMIEKGLRTSKDQEYQEAVLNTFRPEVALKFDQINKELNNKMDNMKFSYMLNKKSSTELFNETLYGGIIDKNDSNKVIKINKLHLLDATTKREALDKIFGEARQIEKVIKKDFKSSMEEHDPKTFEALVKIYNTYLEAKNPFIESLGENKSRNLELTIINSKGKQVSRFVRDIKTFGSNQTIDNIIEKKHNNKNENNKISFNESFNWVELHLYKGLDKKENSKYFYIPINALFAKFQNNKIITNDKYNKWLEKNDLKQENGKRTLYKGSIWRNKSSKQLFYISGISFKAQKIEIKTLVLTKNILLPSGEEKSERFFITINTFLNNYVQLNIDELGNY